MNIITYIIFSRTQISLSFSLMHIYDFANIIKNLQFEFLLDQNRLGIQIFLENMKFSKFNC
jgi:hypothetical protein